MKCIINHIIPYIYCIAEMGKTLANSAKWMSFANFYLTRFQISKVVNYTLAKHWSYCKFAKVFLAKLLMINSPRFFHQNFELYGMHKLEACNFSDFCNQLVICKILILIFWLAKFDLYQLESSIHMHEWLAMFDTWNQWWQILTLPYQLLMEVSEVVVTSLGINLLSILFCTATMLNCYTSNKSFMFKHCSK